MVPDGVFRETLGLFFAEHFTVLSVFWWDFCFVYFLGGFLGGSYRGFAE